MPYICLTKVLPYEDRKGSQMDTDHLHDHWTTGPRFRWSRQPYSFRLPTFVGAQIDALCEIYPQRNKTEIVTDLLIAALADLNENLPSEDAPVAGSRKNIKGGVKAVFERRTEEIRAELDKRYYGYAPYVKVLPANQDEGD